MLIANNDFTGNAAYYDAVGIYIRAKTSTGVLLNNIDFVNEDNVECGGYLVQENMFSSNFGCPTKSGAIFKFTCIDEDTEIMLNDESDSTNILSSEMDDMISFKGNNEQYLAIAFTKF